MKILLTALTTLLATAAGPAAAPPDFSGTWAFKVERSQNAQMMAAVQYTSRIAQTPDQLTVHDVSVYQGKEQAQDTRYDLTGRSVENASPMGDPSKTVSHWEGQRLVTQWTSAGAIAGTTVVRTEIRWLSEDGSTMSVSSAREGRPPMVLVFERR
jgi:hypothetical protein